MGEKMTVSTFVRSRDSLRHQARVVRLSLGLTEQEVADLAGVPREAVYCYEHDLPVSPEFRPKILRALFACKEETPVQRLR